MKPLTRHALIGAGILIAAAAVVAAGNRFAGSQSEKEEVRPLRPGAKAPDFTLPDSRGETRALSDARGKVVVLEWLNHGCPFVKKHYNTGNMQKLQADAVKRGAVWYSVISSAPGKQGYSTPKEAEQDRKEKKSNATAVLLDPEGRVGRLYGARTTPHLFVIDAEGRVAYMGAIDSKPTTDPSDIEDAENYVAAALDAVFAGKKPDPASTKPYGCSVKY